MRSLRRRSPNRRIPALLDPSPIRVIRVIRGSRRLHRRGVNHGQAQLRPPAPTKSFVSAEDWTIQRRNDRITPD